MAAEKAAAVNTETTMDSSANLQNDSEQKTANKDNTDTKMTSMSKKTKREK